MVLLFSPFELGNYRWSEMLLWITLVIAATFAVLLFADYLNRRNQTHLLYSVALTAIALGIYMIQMYANTTAGASRGDPTIFNFTGDYTVLIWPDYQSIPYAIINTLMLIAPGLITAGLLYSTFDDKKFGDLTLIFNGIMIPITIVLFCDPSNGANELVPGLAYLAQMVLQIPMYLGMIVLPILRNKDEKEGYLISITGLIMLVFSILYVVMALGTDVSRLEGGFIDIVFMIYPFFLMAVVIFLAFGFLIPKKWSFSISGVEFAER
jgi:hypothetical protein